ncbi:MAG: hypothetical protein HN404_26765, partial [Gemmatimonadetes bacterium]|nr:hypothetical protein [Gemmatimonadota bacterium]
QPIESGSLEIDDNPIRETRLVLADGLSEPRYVTTQGMEITVTGIELRNVPDVILTPGQSDSVQIGSLNSYILNTLASVDDITWTFEPTSLESLSVEIRPDEGNKVVIIPVEGWRGKQRIVWTATEPPRIAGRPPLTVTEVSDIIVNNPPLFDFVADSLNVKRDTIRITEDRFVYARGTISPDIRRAHRHEDLDLLVIDPDVVDPLQELRFAVSSPYSSQPATEANVRGDDDEATHDLLVWSATDFAGTDSLQVLVQDLQGARDSLRVIVIVDEVPDAPRFLLGGEELEPRISRGGTKSYRWDEFVEDPDTPLDSLILRWQDDPAEHFRVDTTRVAGDLVITIEGDPGFAGGPAQIRFFVDDPVDPVNLSDNISLFITASEALPPNVFPSDTKIDLARNGSDQRELDEFVEDPDNDDSELTWSLPGVTQNSLGVDEKRTLTTIAKQDFV